MPKKAAEAEVKEEVKPIETAVSEPVENEAAETNEVGNILNFGGLRKLLNREAVDISDQRIIDEAAEKISKLLENEAEIIKNAESLVSVLQDSGVVIIGGDSIIGAARAYILAQNAELQVLDTTLIAKGIKAADSTEHPIEAAVKFISNYQIPIEEIVLAGRNLAKGTKLQLAGETVVLADKAIVNYRSEDNEPKFVGLCVHSDNLEANKPNFRFRYNGFGIRLPVTEQVDKKEDLPAFIKGLTEEEAESFGVTEQWKKLNDKS